MSAIEWTDQTWNPATGCTKVSPGCKNCYAETMSFRLKKMGNKKYANAFDYTEHPDELTKPQHWKKPRMIFVNSMSDLFHEAATDSFINDVFEIMMTVKRHTYQILTKRPQRMKEFVDKFISVRGGLDEIPNHIWLGTSVESSDYLFRIDQLRQVNCAVRFVSFEPLLGPILPGLTNIHWAIVGGESGHGARPIQEYWVKSIRDVCKIYNTAFFFKQWGGYYPKQKGNLLEGRKYLEYPKL